MAKNSLDNMDKGEVQRYNMKGRKFQGIYIYIDRMER